LHKLLVDVVLDLLEVDASRHEQAKQQLVGRLQVQPACLQTLIVVMTDRDKRKQAKNQRI
jgi:hypothetical protein